MRVHVKFVLRIVTMFLPLFMLGGCGGLTIEETPVAIAMLPPEDVRPAPIGFNKIRFAIPTGTPTIASAPANLWEWAFVCEGPHRLLKQGSIRGRGFPTDSRREIFTDTMEALGYDVAGNPGFLFDEDADLQRTHYVVGGRVTDIKINTCAQNGWFNRIPRGDSGQSSITIEWTVHDLLQRKNILKVTTKGYGRILTPSYDGVLLLIDEAIAASIHNLGANKDLHNLVFYGQEPEKLPNTIHDPYEEPISQYDLLEKLTIENKPLSTKSAKERLEKLVKSAVLIQAGNTHGSGYFITTDGYIVTNAHVVGYAKRVRVVTSGKEEKFVAEVVRVDRKRDVALLKLEKIPPDLQIQTLPIREDKLALGEDVYAIGSPSYTRLQDTITKGIVSSHRFDRLRKQWEIQADVYIYGGNSGGPLLDKNGNIVGMAVAKYIRGDENLDGLNLFIPIKDVLKKLDIELK